MKRKMQIFSICKTLVRKFSEDSVSPIVYSDALMLPSQLVFLLHVHFHVPFQSAFEIPKILAENTSFPPPPPPPFDLKNCLKIPNPDLEMLKQRKFIFITLRYFEISKAKFKDHSLPKEAENVAVCVVQTEGEIKLGLREVAQVWKVCRPDAHKLLSVSTLRCHQVAFLCGVPDFFLHFGSGGHLLRT